MNMFNLSVKSKSKVYTTIKLENKLIDICFTLFSASHDLFNNMENGSKLSQLKRFGNKLSFSFKLIEEEVSLVEIKTLKTRSMNYRQSVKLKS